MKTIVITPVPAPYQIAFAKALHQLTDIEFWFLTSIKDSTRPDYWEMDLPDFCRILKTYFRKIQLFYCPDLIKLLNEKNPDCLILHGKWNNLSWFYAYRWAKKHQKKIVMGPLEYPTNRNWFKETLRKILYSQIDAYLCVGYKSLDYYATIRDENKTYLFSYAADLDRELNHPPRDINKNICFLHSGSINERFRVLELLNAFENVASIYENCHLYLSGNGPLKNTCIDKIENSKPLNGKVSWIDVKSWEEVQDLYLSSHVLISYPKYAGWGLTIPEAMASGMGIIAGIHVEAGRELIIQGYNGYLVRNKTELERAMISYLLETSLITTHGKINKDIARKEGVQEKARELVQILNDLL